MFLAEIAIITVREDISVTGGGIHCQLFSYLTPFMKASVSRPGNMESLQWEINCFSYESDYFMSLIDFN